MVHRIGTVGGDIHLKNRALAFATDRLHRDARQRKIIRQLAVVDPEVNEITQPLWRNLHFVWRGRPRPRETYIVCDLKIQTKNKKLRQNPNQYLVARALLPAKRLIADS